MALSRWTGEGGWGGHNIRFTPRAAMTKKLTTVAITMIRVACRPLDVAKGIMSVYHSHTLAVLRTLASGDTGHKKQMVLAKSSLAGVILSSCINLYSKLSWLARLRRYPSPFSKNSRGEAGMRMDFVSPSPPSEDRRWRLVDGTMRRHGRQPHALIESLHTVQESFGYLDMEALRYVAAVLRVPLSQVYGVATFYHFFSLKPQGEHTCVVCLGTACYIKGAANIVAAIEDTMHIKVGETTVDGQLSLLSARCLGSCGLAPAAVLDGEVVGKISEAQVLERIREWTSHDGG